MQSHFIFLVLAAATIMVTSCGTPSEKEQPKKEQTKASEIAGNAQKGKSLYTTCAACHGQNAEGMAALNAPALADQEPYYLKMQLNNFRTNKRGSHEKDIFGAQMQPMAKVLNSEGIADVIAYIKTLTPSKPEATIEGDIANGQNYYNMICGACHGPGATGIESLHSPKLIGMQDWYLERQLNNFRDSIRGTAEGDVFGAQMQQIAASIPDDQTVKDIVAYLNSLQEE
ncbi:MAG: c-type cytochrome [Flavobacteriales bacterium]|nr:c-type cytochrome [Flavobacteriales bacterium]